MAGACHRGMGRKTACVCSVRVTITQMLPFTATGFIALYAMCTFKGQTVSTKTSKGSCSRRTPLLQNCRFVANCGGVPAKKTFVVFHSSPHLEVREPRMIKNRLPRTVFLPLPLISNLFLRPILPPFKIHRNYPRPLLLVLQSNFDLLPAGVYMKKEPTWWSPIQHLELPFVIPKTPMSPFRMCHLTDGRSAFLVHHPLL